MLLCEKQLSLKGARYEIINPHGVRARTNGQTPAF